MAYRIITQVVFTGARVFGRAVSEAYRHAAATQKYQAAGGATGTGPNTSGNTAGLSLEEAYKILNLGPSKGGIANSEQVTERFKRLYDINDPKKGGSFYVQSKVLRARERIDIETRRAEQKAQREQELQHGWRPKLYKDR